MTMNSSTIDQDKLQALVKDSLDLIAASLNNPELTLLDRVTVALKVLEMAGVYSQQIVESNHRLEALQPDIIQSTMPRLMIPPKFVQIDNFLSAEAHQTVLEISRNHQSEFFEAGIFNQAPDYRKSLVLLLKDLPDFYEMMRLKVLEFRPNVLEELGLSNFLVSFVEMQITAHNDGGFYKIHSDADPNKAINRVLSYVYYFYQEPRAFYGGELRLYETHLIGDESTIQENFMMIQPRNNSIVFFDSRCKHEILPVSCPSGDFAHSRFTVNGWVRR
ncbi:MAG: 2OG-Fe(II) oxygenase [Oscillatoriales cyanobacterium RM2_1_1]|nr:2OG-Fe(II) oxygenase [Oscillatoriales cyanobacterium RM2_1_1]